MRRGSNDDAAHTADSFVVLLRLVAGVSKNILNNVPCQVLALGGHDRPTSSRERVRRVRCSSRRRLKTTTFRSALFERQHMQWTAIAREIAQPIQILLHALRAAVSALAPRRKENTVGKARVADTCVLLLHLNAGVLLSPEPQKGPGRRPGLRPGCAKRSVRRYRIFCDACSLLKMYVWRAALGIARRATEERELRGRLAAVPSRNRTGGARQRLQVGPLQRGVLAKAAAAQRPAQPAWPIASKPSKPGGGPGSAR